MATPDLEASRGGRGRRAGFPWLLAIVSFALLAVLLSLGTWQVRRLAWKNDLAATIETRLASAPAPIGEIEALVRTGADIEYRPAVASGTFLHDREQYFLATHGGQAGWFVYTPLETGAGTFLFVNRGFVPFDRRDPASRTGGQPSGVATVRGLARAAPAARPGWLVPDNQPAARTFYWKDRAAMASSAGLDPAAVLPLFLDADDTPNVGGLPVGGVTIVALSNNHLQYAVTWYGLAAALLGVVGLWIWRATSKEDRL